MQNLDKWANRIVSNLLYYQTNYLVSAMIIFSLVAYAYPQEMLVGIVTVVSAIYPVFDDYRVEIYFITASSL